MRKLLRTIAPIALLALMPSVAHAGSQNGTYVAAAVVSSTAGGRCVSQANTCVALLGGFSIPMGPTAISLKITDTAGPGAPYSVCQDNSPDPAAGPFCGDATADVDFTGCSSGAFKPYSGFKTNANINVFVFSVSLTCDGTGTVGTWNVTW